VLFRSNWIPAKIPVAANDVVIPGQPSIQPHITSTVASPAICNNLTIKTAAVLTVDAAKALTVSGTLTNDAGVSGLVLKSDVNGTASLLNNTAGINASIERYISSPGNYHMLGSPVTSQSIASLSSASDSLFIWDEASENWISKTAVTFSSLNGGSNFVAAKAYAVLFANIVTLNFSGLMNTGSVGVPINFTNGSYQGWNFIANPYPSSINWDATSGWSRSMLENAIPGEKAIWIWNPLVQNYGSYISNSGAGTNGVSNNIPPSQGFWVKATTAATLSMNDNIKNHSTQSYLKQTVTTEKKLRLKVVNASNNFSDEIIIGFGYSDGSGGSEKIFSMNTSAPDLYTVKNNKNWSINCLTEVSENSIINLGFKPGANAMFNLHFGDISTFNSAAYVYLKDLKNNSIIDMRQNADYSFTAAASDNANRFQLIFAMSPLNISDHIIRHTGIYASDNNVCINTNENIRQISIYNTIGQLIKQIEGSGNGNITITMNAYPKTNYIVKVITDKSSYNQKVLIR
jgi:hypothetical protein